jgi:hypothetical protein
MILIAKLLILGVIIIGTISVTRRFRSERLVLAESGIDGRLPYLSIVSTWVCILAPLATIFPVVGAFLAGPLPLAALLVFPAVVLLKRIKLSLERRGTDRTRKASDATDRALLVAYGSAALAIADWGLSLAVSSIL